MIRIIITLSVSTSLSVLEREELLHISDLTVQLICHHLIIIKPSQG